MLQLKNIYKSYIVGEEKQQVLKDINITFRKNEFVSILGASGSGKTTLLSLTTLLLHFLSLTSQINELPGSPGAKHAHDSSSNHV